MLFEYVCVVFIVVVVIIAFLAGVISYLVRHYKAQLQLSQEQQRLQQEYEPVNLQLFSTSGKYNNNQYQ